MINTAIATPVILYFNMVSDFSSPAFVIAKIYTVALSAILVWFIFKNPDGTLAKRARVAFFGINIMEAVVTEIVVKGTWLNPIAGLLCILALPLWKTLNVDKETNRLRWESSDAWVLAYSIWNICFTLSLYPHMWYINTFHVVIAHIIVLRDPGWYAEIRAISLNISLCLTITFWPAIKILTNEDRLTGPFETVQDLETFVFWLGAAAFAVAVWAVGEQIYKKTGRTWAIISYFNRDKAVTA